MGWMGGGRDGGANGASHPRAPGGEKQGAALARKVGGGLRNITRERKGGGEKNPEGGKNEMRGAGMEQRCPMAQ